MSNHSKLRNLRSKGIHFKNKYKFMMLKRILMPQIREEFVGSNVNKKIYITISIRVLFWCLICRHSIFKKMEALIFASFIIFRFNVCVLAAIIIGTCSTGYFEELFSYHEWKQLFTQKCATNYQTHLENQLNNVWTWNNSMLMKYHTGDSAEWIRIIWAQFGRQVLGTARLTDWLQ